MSDTSRTSKTSGATTMADLMKSVKTTFTPLYKGENVKGTIKKLTPNEILVDINAKTDAVVLEKEKKNVRNIMASLKVGDTVTVSILNPESDFGHPVVSLRRFLEDITWEKLTQKQKNQETVDVTVNEKTPGGFVVTTMDGMKGFLPNSHLSIDSGASDLMGRSAKVYVLDLNRQSHKIIFSQRPVIDSKAFEEATKKVEVNKKIEGVVSNVTPFGVFVSVPLNGKNIDGLIHISEIAWEKVETTDEMFKVGEKVEAVVIGKDFDAKRLDLSIKRQTSDPFKEQSKKYTVDQKVSGVVTKVSSVGVSLDLGDGAEGLIRKEKIPPTVSYKEGDTVKATVSQIDTKKRKILLVPVMLEKFVGYK